MFERKKTEKKIDCPPKNENAPTILANGTNFPLVIKS